MAKKLSKKWKIGKYYITYKELDIVQMFPRINWKVLLTEIFKTNQDLLDKKNVKKRKK